MKTLMIKNIGPIKEASIAFSDLTIFIGTQASGKSITLEIIKLIKDFGYIKGKLSKFGFGIKNLQSFLATYFGPGKESIINKKTTISVDSRNYDLEEHFTKSRATDMKCFYIPAQRVVTIENGWPKPFNTFDSSYPFVTREFSENIREFLDKSYDDESGNIFPQNNRLKNELRNAISKSIFKTGKIKLKTINNRKGLYQETSKEVYIPISTWSAGQREFIPLLCGLYYCLPSSKVTTRDKIDTIIIEELEMGLHPAAIINLMLLIFELIKREYKVILSTHSSAVIDIVWAINEIKKNNGSIKDFLKLFDVSNSQYYTSLWNSIKKLNTSVNYFRYDENDAQVTTESISDLDPISGWGGLTEFSGKFADVVSELYKD